MPSVSQAALNRHEYEIESYKKQIATLQQEVAYLKRVRKFYEGQQKILRAALEWQWNDNG